MVWISLLPARHHHLAAYNMRAHADYRYNESGTPGSSVAQKAGRYACEDTIAHSPGQVRYSREQYGTKEVKR